MTRKLPREIECKRADARLNDLLDDAYNYARRKRLGAENVRRMEDFEDEWREYPEHWTDSVYGMMLTGALFTSPKHVSGFVRSAGKTLGPASLDLARSWRQQPWFFCAFTVVEDYGDNLLEVQPLGDSPKHLSPNMDWDHLLLYSPGITDAYRHGRSLCIALLWWSGHAFHTYGALLPFTGLDQTDLFFFADVARHLHTTSRREPLLGIPGRTTDICDQITQAPLSFLRLFKYSESPRMNTPYGAARWCASMIQYDESLDRTMTDETTWRFELRAANEEIDGTIFDQAGAAIWLGEGHGLKDPTIFLSFSDRLVFLSALTEQAYQRGRQAAARMCRFPEQPESTASLTAYIAAKEILQFSDRIAELHERFGEPPASEPPDEEQLEEPNHPAGIPEAEMADLRTVMDRLTYNHNEGIAETDEEIANDLGVPVDMVTNLRGNLDQLFSRTNEPEALDPPPPQATSRGTDGETNTGANETTHYDGAPRADDGIPAGANETTRRDSAPRAEDGTPTGANETTHYDGAADRFGLSPRAFSQLTRGGVPDAPGALVLREYRDLVAEIDRRGLHEQIRRVPAIRFALWILEKATAAGGLTVTQAGYINTATVRAAIAEKALPLAMDPLEVPGPNTPELLRPKKEADWPQFLEFRNLLERAELLQFDGRKFQPHDHTGMLLEAPAALYHLLLTVMFTNFAWDDHPRFSTIPYIRQYAGFLFYAIGALATQDPSQHAPSNRGLLRHSPSRRSPSDHHASGDSPSQFVETSDLADRFIAAAPPLAQAAAEYNTTDPSDPWDGRAAHQAGPGPRFIVRFGLEVLFLDRFAEAFGLIEFERSGNDRQAGPSPTMHPRFRPTELFEAVFRS